MRDNGTWRLTPGSTTEPRGSGPGGGGGGGDAGTAQGLLRIGELLEQPRVQGASTEPG